ncbi:MAG: hypothetical protein LQ343_006123 [Gyalolechia ehrenbergii]|nr:MAG: hypothetical protein LQ343_006123 [Gyalolechia ehrenbergii]
MSTSPADRTPGRTPNGTLPPLRRRRQNADPLVRPKDRNRRPPLNNRPQNVAQTIQPNGIAPGRTQVISHHPGRPTAPQRRSTPDLARDPEPTSGFSSVPLGPVHDIPLVTTKKSLMEGLRHHVARFASRKPVDPRNTDEFTRPVRLHRRDPRIPVPGKDDLTGEGAENGAVDDKEKELQDAMKVEKKRERELNLAQIAPSANPSGQRKNHYGKKTHQVYRNDQTDEQKAASRLRYEETMPWHLEDFDNKSTWVGTYEAALSDTYVAFILGNDGKFRMVPMEKWYKFSSKQQFKILSIDEAEKAMDKKVAQPRWFMDTQKATRFQENEVPTDRANKGLYLGKFEEPRIQATVRSRGLKAEPDADDLDFEEDRFADDEENPYLEGPEEDNKEIEEKVKRDQLRANFFDNKDEKEADEEEEARKKERELEKAFGKSYKKSLMKQEKNYIYDSDSDNPYSAQSESESSETERRKEEAKKKEEEQKGNGSDREKAKAGKGSRNPSGANTPSGRPSKHLKSLKKTASSNNLKRPSSPNASDASGNESSRKKRKQQHFSAELPQAQVSTSSTSLKPLSRPMSPDYAPPSSAPQRPTGPATSEQVNNKRPRADAGSGSEMSGGEISDGKRKKQKLKLRMSASPNRSPNGSRAVSPDVKAEKANGAAAAAPKAANPPAAATTVPPLDITSEEALGLIPPEGIHSSDLVKYFRGRISKEQMGQFRVLMKTVSKYNNETKRFMPLP